MPTSKLHGEKRIKAVDSGGSEGAATDFEDGDIIYDTAGGGGFKKKTGGIGAGTWDPIGGGGGVTALSDVQDVDGYTPSDVGKRLEYVSIDAQTSTPITWGGSTTLSIECKKAGKRGSAGNDVIVTVATGTPASATWNAAGNAPYGQLELIYVHGAGGTTAAAMKTEIDTNLINGAPNEFIVTITNLDSQEADTATIGAGPFDFANGAELWQAKTIAASIDWTQDQGGSPVIDANNYTDTTYNDMQGDSGAGGAAGLVPAPGSGDAAAGKYLKASGTWETVTVSLAGTMTGHIIPDTNDVYDIGSADYKIRDLYVSDNSLWVGDDHKVEVGGGKMKFKKRKSTAGYIPSGLQVGNRTDGHGAINIANAVLMKNQHNGLGAAGEANTSGMDTSNMTTRDWLRFANFPDGNTIKDDAGGVVEAHIGLTAVNVPLGGWRLNDVFKRDQPADWESDYEAGAADWAAVVNKPTIPTLLQDLQDVPAPGGGDNNKFLRYNTEQNGYVDVDMTGNGDVLRFTVHSSSNLTGADTNGVVVKFQNTSQKQHPGSWHPGEDPKEFRIQYDSNPSPGVGTTLQDMIDTVTGEVTATLQAGDPAAMITDHDISGDHPTNNYAIAGWSAGDVVAAEMVGASAGGAGQAGSVPAPAAGEQNMFLKADKSWADVPAPPPPALDELGQTDISGPSNGEVLSYNGANWVNAAAGGSVANLVDVGDVAPTSGAGSYKHVLTYEDTAGRVPASVTVSGIGDTNPQGSLKFEVSEAHLTGANGNSVMVTFNIGSSVNNTVFSSPTLTVHFEAGITTLDDIINKVATIPEINCTVTNGVTPGNTTGFAPGGTVYSCTGGVNGTAEWRAAPAPMPNMNIGDLQNVDDAPPADGQVLKWSNSNNRWEPAADISGGGGANSISQADSEVRVDDPGQGADGEIIFKTNNSNRWKITSGGHILPMVHATGNSPYPGFDIGSAENKVRHLFLSSNSLWIGDQHKIDIGDNGKMKFKKRKTDVVPPKIEELNSAQPEAQRYDDGAPGNSLAANILSGVVAIVGAPLDGSSTLADVQIQDWITFAQAAPQGGNAGGLGQPLTPDEIFRPDEPGGGLNPDWEDNFEAGGGGGPTEIPDLSWAGGFDDSQANEKFLPINTDYEDPTVKHWNQKIMLKNGKITKVVLRGSADAGSTTCILVKNGVDVQTETESWNVADTTGLVAYQHKVEFNFATNNTFAEGDVVMLKVNPTSGFGGRVIFSVLQMISI